MIDQNPTTEEHDDTYEEDEEEDDEDEDDNEDEDDVLECDVACHCNISRLEHKVLEDVGQDVVLATYLIPFVHNAIHQQSISSFGTWKSKINQCAPHPDGSGTTIPPVSGSKNGSGSGGSKKRKFGNGNKQSGSGQDEQDGSEDRDPQEPAMSSSSDNDNGNKHASLACPFHKFNPGKYNCGTERYRVCHGPGFKEFKNLK